MQPSITVPIDALDLTINASGQVEVTLAGNPAPQVLGQLQLATFVNDAGLDAIGDNLLIETAASGGPTTGNAGRRRLWRVAAELPGNLERQHRV